MRNIKTPDLFTLMRIMRKANVKQKIIKMNPANFESLSESETGALITFEIIESAPDAQDDIMKFLADIGEVDVKELENDEFELLPKIIDHLMSQEKFIDFLSTAFNKMN